MKYNRLILGTLIRLRTSQAFIDPTSRNGTVAEFTFVDPDLIDNAILYPDSFIEPQDIDIPQDFTAQVGNLENALGLETNSAQINPKAGRISGLELAEPILPGAGVNNPLLWNVFEEGVEHVESSMTPEQWEQIAIEAVKNWMVDHALELDINVETEMFAEGTVRTAVHGDGDMIQMHIPRVFKGVVVEGCRASATLKLGNLISVSFEEWGTIPEEFDVKPVWTVKEAYLALERHSGRKIVAGERNCKPELQILTLTPAFAMGFGDGYEYALAWKLCPIFKEQEQEMMEGKVDAKTGKVYAFQDTVHYLQAKGGVYPIANDGRNPDGQEQAGWPMPFMYVGSELTDTGGNYNTAGTMNFATGGKYMKINSDTCGSSSLSGANGIDWGTSGGTDCE